MPKFTVYINVETPIHYHQITSIIREALEKANVLVNKVSTTTMKKGRKYL